MKVLVCYKWVLDEADISINVDDLSLNFEKAKYKISEYDRNAIELGAKLQESNGCTLHAATIGHGVKASANDVLSRGPEEVFYIDNVKLENTDSAVTAKLLAGIAKKIGDIGIIICGNGSSDFYSQQVGPRLAALLGYPSVSYATSVKLNGSEIIAERKLEDGSEYIKVKGPAVISILPEINKPRIPGLKQILAAKKKPSTSISLEEIGITESEIGTPIEVKKVIAAVMDRKQTRIGCDDMNAAEIASILVKQFQSDGIIN